MRYLGLLFLGVFLSSCGLLPVTQSLPQPKAGTVIFDNSTGPSVRNLDGYWLMARESLVRPGDRFDWNSDKVQQLWVPSTWNRYYINNEWMHPIGTSTYRLHIVNPSTHAAMALKISAIGSAFELYANGKLLAYGGAVHADPAQSRPGYAPQVVALPASQEGWEVLLVVSNGHHRFGGIFYSWLLGPEPEVRSIQVNHLILEAALFGTLIFMGLYNLALFLFLKKGRDAFYLGLISLLLGLRVILYGEYLFLNVFPFIDWEFFQKLGYLTFNLTPALFYRFFQVLFPNETPKIFVKSADLAAASAALTTLALPQFWYSQIQFVYQIWVMVISAFSFYILLQAWQKKRDGALLILLGMVFFGTTVFNDMLHVGLKIQTGYLLPFGTLAFILFHSLVILSNYTKAYLHIDQLSQSLLENNMALTRFVPVQFLQLLGKKAITEVKLGDQQRQSMTIMFVDIRSFTKLSEKMTSEENFKFINSYLERVSPCIHRENGFIDKYLGDGLMALFPESPEDAIRAGLKILRAVRRYNRDRMKSGYQAIRIGIGVHSGDIIMGTIGNNDRMDNTVIADAVNLASRLESLNKTFGTNFLTSRQTFDLLKDGHGLKNRFLGEVAIRGKSKPIAVIEIFHADPERVKLSKSGIKKEFEKAVSEFLKGRTKEAEALFLKIQKKEPGDRAIRSYLRRLSRCR